MSQEKLPPLSTSSVLDKDGNIVYTSSWCTDIVVTRLVFDAVTGLVRVEPDAPKKVIQLDD